LVSCLHGKIYLVVLDVRPHSTTYGKWESFIISPETATQVLIPPYFANGHFVMEDDSIFHYKMAYQGEYNDENKQKTIVWNDNRFNIEWPMYNPILSKRDRNGN
jgi:dTDP-4-dehydrorhamnose 3,5-epimerase